MQNTKHRTFSFCEHCKKELDEYNQRIGSAYHTDCWKKEVDTDRHDSIIEYSIDEITQEIRVPIYDKNGRRYKDYETA